MIRGSGDSSSKPLCLLTRANHDYVAMCENYSANNDPRYRRQSNQYVRSKWWYDHCPLPSLSVMFKHFPCLRTAHRGGFLTWESLTATRSPGIVDVLCYPFASDVCIYFDQANMARRWSTIEMGKLLTVCKEWIKRVWDWYCYNSRTNHVKQETKRETRVDNITYSHSNSKSGAKAVATVWLLWGRIDFDGLTRKIRPLKLAIVEIQDRSLKNDWYQTWAMYKKTSP